MPLAINSRIALSLASIAAAGALIVGATFAFFSDSGQSTNNQFGAGTMNLQLDDSDQLTPVDNVTATFNVSGMAPGDKAAQEISFHNGGTVSIAEIAMGLTSTNTDGDLDGSDLRDKLNMKVVSGGTASSGDCTGGSDQTSAIDLAVGNNSAPLTMTEFTGDTYDSLPISLAPAADGKVCIQVVFDSGANNTYQGDSANATFTFTAHQDTSQ